MKNIDSIASRIVFIINESKRKKASITSEDLKNNPELFEEILGYSIYKDYTSEFWSLIDKEKSEIEMSDKDEWSKDLSLLEACWEAINKIYENDDRSNMENTKIMIGDLLRVIEIINISRYSSPSALINYKGYHVNQGLFIEFINLCGKLPLESTKELSDKNIELHELNYIVTHANDAQKQRIVTYLGKYSDRKEENALYSSVYSYIVYLGIKGLLDSKIITSLGEIMPTIEFNGLLKVLESQNIISLEELEKYKRNAVEKNINIDTLDGLLAYFISQGINKNTLNGLREILNADQFQYCVKKLFDMKYITSEEYQSIFGNKR